MLFYLEVKLLQNKIYLALFAIIPGLLIFAYIVLFSYFVPIIDEDFSLYASGKSFVDVVWLCADQYLHWNARIGDVLSILFSTLPQHLYNIVNGICISGFLFLLIFLAKIVTGKEKVGIVTWMAMIVLLFLAMIYYLPKPNEVFFWRTGAANYFYPTLFSLLYLIPLLRNITTSRTIKNPILAGFYIILGVVIGHSNENVAPVIFMFFTLWVVVQYFKNKQLNIVFAGSSFSLLVGVCLLLFGPSTQHRIEFYNKLYGNSSVLHNIITNSIPVIHDYLLLIVPSIVLTILLVCFQRETLLRKKLWTISLVSYSVSIASVLILLCAPYYTQRAMFFSAVILLIPVIAGLIVLSRRLISVLFAVFLTLLVISTPVLINQFETIRKLSYSKQNLLQSVQQQLNKTSTAVIHPISVDESLLIYNGCPSQEITRLSHFFHYPEGSVRLK